MSVQTWLRAATCQLSDINKDPEMIMQIKAAR